MNTRLWTIAIAAGLSACTPRLEDVLWSCSQSSDCGEGYVCDLRQTACMPADGDGLNGVFDDRLVLGMSSALTTGPVALGQGMKDGIETCFNHINSIGGVHGRRLELVALDDGYEPQQALDNMKQLIESRSVFGIVGNVGTPTANVTVPYAVEQRTLFFGAFTGAGLLRKDPPERYVFNFRASYKQETAATVRYFTQDRDDKIDPRNLGVLPQGEDSNGTIDPFGQSGFDGVADALDELFDIPSSDIPYWTYKRNTVEVNPAVKVFLKWLGDGQRVKADGKISAAIIMIPTYKPAAAFIKGMLETISAIKRGGAPNPDYQLTQAEIDELLTVKEVLFSSVSFVGANDFANELSGFGAYTNLDGVQDMFCNQVVVSQVVPHYASAASGVLDYRDQLALFDPNLQSGFVSLEGYLAARLLVTALEQQGRELTPESFIHTLENIGNVDFGIGTVLTFSPSQHQASNKIWGTSMDANCRYQSIEL